MRKQLRAFLTTASLCSLLWTAQVAPIHAAPATQSAPPSPIILEVGTLGSNQPLPLDPDLTRGNYAPGEVGYYILQFSGPVQNSWKNAVNATGAQLLTYLPDNAFITRMTPEQAAQVSAQPNVQWVGIHQPAYKLDVPLNRSTPKAYQVLLHPGADGRTVARTLIADGITVLSRQNEILLISATGAQLKTVARQLDVAWIEEFQFAEPLNEYGGGVIIGSAAVNANGYRGENQVIAIADTGLDRGDQIEAFPDIPNRRIRALFNWPGAPSGCNGSIVDDGPQDVDSGHGTHVAVSALGLGDANGIGRGVAPAAELVFQALENFVVIKQECSDSRQNGYYLVGLPSDLHDLFAQAYTAGARIHSNSWGNDRQGQYTVSALQVDKFVHKVQDLTIVFAAGNAGRDDDHNNIIDSGSIGSPATAKNAISVGASENARADGYPCDPALATQSDISRQTCAQMGGVNAVDIWPHFSFQDPTAGNAEQMAAFSSRGPTRDQRIKPDVVAPGTWILSGYSDLYQNGYNSDPRNPQNNQYQDDGNGLPFNEHYKYFSGTSMAAPLVAGGAALVRQFYMGKYQHTPTAALIKATLINSAEDLLDENNDGANDNAFPIPNEHEGWGRINLVNATDGSHEFVDDRTGIATGNTATYRYTLPGDRPFKVSLVWSDAPGNPLAGPDLVNNLDLVVTSPGATTYRGNWFGGGWSLPGGPADRVNNVENVYIQTAEAGIWTVEVKGINVPVGMSESTPGGTQPFALVIDYMGEDENCIITGDLNCDRTVNIVDLQVLINMILRNRNPDFNLYPRAWWTRGDLNGDGTWNIVDLQMLINIIVG